MKPFKPPPAPVTRALIALCTAVQVAVAFGGEAFGTAVIETAGLIPARLSGDIVGGAIPAVLTLVTSQFVHVGWTHLALNLFFLAWVGRHVEWLFGRWRFAGLYVGGGIIGGLLQCAVDPHSTQVFVGASGAIAAVFGAYAVMFARSRASGRRLFGVAIGSDAANALWLAVVWIGLQLALGSVLELGGQGIGAWAHIGGFLTGMAFAIPFARGPQV